MQKNASALLKSKDFILDCAAGLPRSELIKKHGISEDELKLLRLQARRNGIDLDDIQKAFKRTPKSVRILVNSSARTASKHPHGIPGVLADYADDNSIFRR